MKAIEFLKARHRMCSEKKGCMGCPIFESEVREKKSCLRFEELNPEVFVEIVEKWAKENPEPKKKTYLHDFKEKFPGASLGSDGYPAVLWCQMYSENCILDSHCTRVTCNKIWDREMP